MPRTRPIKQSTLADTHKLPATDRQPRFDSVADEAAPLLIAIAQELDAIAGGNGAARIQDARQLLADTFNSIDQAREIEHAAA